MIDANIPLQTQAPQVPAMMGQLVSLKNAGIAQQESQLKLNQDQQSAQDDSDVRAAYAAAMKPDPQTGQVTLDKSTLLNTIGKLNPLKGAQMASQLSQQDMAAQEASTKLQQAQADTQKAQITAAVAHVSAIDQLLQGVTDQPTYTAALQHAQALGITKPGELPQVYDPQLVQRLHSNALTQKETLEQHQKDQAAALAGQNSDETARHNQATEANTAAYQGQEIGVRRQANAIDAGKLSLDRQKFQAGQLDGGNGQATGDAYLQTLPAGTQAQVKAMANGDIAIPPAGARNAQAQALRQAVLAYDPTYTDARYKSKQQFKTGPDAQSITQLATAGEHLDNALSNSAKVGYAPVAGLTGFALNTPEAKYNQDIKFFAGEAGKLVKSGVVTEGELKDLKDGMNSSRQSIRDAAINETANLVGGKVQGLFQKYKTATGQDLPVSQFFDQPTQQRLQRFGVTGGQQGSAPSSAATHRYNPATGKIEAIQ